MTPTISIVMAAKNYARFLPMAVQSVLSQSFADWELIVVDDGSTDATPRVIEPFLADGRIRYVRSDRLGQSRAKNLGIGLARGGFIAFLDADDCWRPSKLHLQIQRFASNTKLGVCFTRRFLMDEAGNERPANDPPPPTGEVLTEIFARNFVCFSSVMLRREVLDRVGRFDPNLDLAIDYDLWLRAARHFPFDFIDEPLVGYRTGHGNLSKRLADRVATAETIMTRAVWRRGLPVPKSVIAEGYASTFRALGFTLRTSEPRQAVRWYLRALASGGDRWAAAKGIVASVLFAIRDRRTPTNGENAFVNR